MLYYLLSACSVLLANFQTEDARCSGHIHIIGEYTPSAPLDHNQFKEATRCAELILYSSLQEKQALSHLLNASSDSIDRMMIEVLVACVNAGELSGTKVLACYTMTRYNKIIVCSDDLIARLNRASRSIEGEMSQIKSNEHDTHSARSPQKCIQDLGRSYLKTCFPATTPQRLEQVLQQLPEPLYQAATSPDAQNAFNAFFIENQILEARAVLHSAPKVVNTEHSNKLAGLRRYTQKMQSLFHSQPKINEVTPLIPKAI